MQITPKSWGVFLRKYLLKKFRTKAAAETYAASIRARVKKNPASASRLAKAAIGVFDTDYDLDLDTNDVRRLKRGAKRVRKATAKRPSRSRGKKNPVEPLVALSTGLSAVVSALTIKKMAAEDMAKKVTRRKAPAKRKTNGKTKSGI